VPSGRTTSQSPPNSSTVSSQALKSRGADDPVAADLLRGPSHGRVLPAGAGAGQCRGSRHDNACRLLDSVPSLRESRLL
jgi:hypothetical protein